METCLDFGVSYQIAFLVPKIEKARGEESYPKTNKNKYGIFQVHID